MINASDDKRIRRRMRRTGHARRWAALAAVLALWGLGLPLAAAPAAAQAPGAVRWGQPVVISGDVPDSSTATIAADPFGGVHVWWTALYHPFPQNPGTLGSIINITQNRGGAWTAPVDVFISPGTYSVAGQTSAVADSRGQLYAAWNGNSSLYFSRAAVDRATDSKNWTLPLEVDTQVQTPYLVLGADLALNLFYLSTRTPPGIYYTRSTDQGGHWSVPEPILEFSSASPTLPQVIDVVMAVEDAQHVLHAMFYDPYQYGIYYASSADAGATWSRVQLLDSHERDNTFAGPSWPSIGLDGQGTLVGLWVSGHDGISCARYSRASTDGGKTWSERKHVLAPMQGCFSRAQFVTDSGGILHMFSVARDDQGMVRLWQSAWTGKDWQAPASFTNLAIVNGPDYDKAGPDRINAVLTEGNKFHLTYFTYDGRVWYVRGDGSSPAVALLPQPASTPVPTGAATNAPTASAGPAAAATAAPVPSDLGGPPANLAPSNAIFAGLVPVLLLLVVVIAVRVRRH